MRRSAMRKNCYGNIISASKWGKNVILLVGEVSLFTKIFVIFSRNARKRDVSASIFPVLWSTYATRDGKSLLYLVSPVPFFSSLPSPLLLSFELKLAVTGLIHLNTRITNVRVIGSANCAYILLTLS